MSRNGGAYPDVNTVKMAGNASMGGSRQLREFAIQETWTSVCAQELGGDALRAWVGGKHPPPLDFTPPIPKESHKLLDDLIGKIPSKGFPFRNKNGAT